MGFKVVEEEVVEMVDPVKEMVASGIKAEEVEEGSSYSNDYVNESLDMTKGFDPTEIQDALGATKGSEGGAVGQKSRHDSFTDENDGGLYTGKTRKVDSSVYELSGFSVMSDKYNSDHMNVNAVFTSIDAAKMCVSGDKFMYVKDGKMTMSTIVEGTPEISDSETILQTYVDGSWRRL